jgi:hypothetical protein
MGLPWLYAHKIPGEDFPFHVLGEMFGAPRIRDNYLMEIVDMQGEGRLGIPEFKLYWNFRVRPVFPRVEQVHSSTFLKIVQPVNSAFQHKKWINSIKKSSLDIFQYKKSGA